MMTRKITLRTAEEVEKLRANNMLVSRTLAALAGMIRPGVKTIELDRFAESFIRDHGAVPGFKGYEGFPYTFRWIAVPSRMVFMGIRLSPLRWARYRLRIGNCLMSHVSL